MATLYNRKNSPFWWIKYREGGKLIQESTHLRVWNSVETQHAKVLLFEKKLIEAKQVKVSNDRWETWVLPFLERRYINPITFKRMRSVWVALEGYFEEKGIVSPRQVTYQLCVEYPEWRKRFVSRNHAINEIKTLSVIMGEAVKLSFISVNPCTRLGLKKDKDREKPEITHEQEATIREALNKPFEGTIKKLECHREWMRIAFEIAIHQGCRLQETSLPFRDINFKKGEITFDAKGDNRFTTKLHPELIPLLKEIQGSGKLKTCEVPVMASKFLRLFFDHIGMPEISFHCCRVTVVTRLARADVSMSKAMKFVGHANQTIHKVYQRLKVDDLSACVEALSANPLPENLDSASSNSKRPPQ